MSLRDPRGGFALLSVLWLIAALAILTLTQVAPAIVARRAAENRTQVTRARWAAHGCLALLRSRVAAGARAPGTDSVAFSETVWCTVESLRPDERLNPNFTDSAGLVRALGDPVMTASILDWIDPDDQPRDGGAEASWYRTRQRATPRNSSLADPAELALVRGFEHATIADLESWFTTRGDGSVSPMRAERWVLESVSGLPFGWMDRLTSARFSSPASAEQLVAALGLQPTIGEFREMERRLSFAEESNVLRIVGHADAGRAVLKSTLIVSVQVQVAGGLQDPDESPNGITVTRMEAR